ncbi:MAG: BNR repeat-containing protein, partial [Massilia sp.]|nr:BNR repeat-containing protein [Massilia sp.]
MMPAFASRALPLFVLLSLQLSDISAFAKEVEVGPGWANNSVNAVIFRKNSLASHDGVQYIAYYNQQRYVMLGKRKIGSAKWELVQTPYQGNAADAHNSISIMVDGEGYLHMAWDHHNHPLRYVKSVRPGSLELSEKQAMIGSDESSVSYPEFHRLPNGDLLFLYRDGASGSGNLVINAYDAKRGKWRRLHSNLISGEGKRNAYWQAFIDHLGTIHLSWVWRESPDVSSNHDMAYARSRDGGVTWENSSGQAYALPITASNVEYALRIPQRSDLINQTSMSADKNGNPYIASYWRDAGASAPQYHVIYRTKDKWESLALDTHKAPFELGGVGTKRIPISRPQIMVDNRVDHPTGLLVFRDEERGSRVSMVSIADFAQGKWKVADINAQSVGS